MKKFLLAAGILALTILLTFGASSVLLRPQHPTATSSVTIQGLLNFTNKNRTTPLALDERLNRSAQAKCEDMVAKDYYAHDAPDGTQPWYFIEEQIGTNPGQKLGENLMNNPTSSQNTVDAWMHSAKHREALQDPLFHEVGFGICHSDSYKANNGYPATLVVQHFAS